MRIQEICSSITDGSHNPPQGVTDSEYLMLSSKNIFDNNITFVDPRYLRKEDFEIEDRRTNIQAGDVLLTIVGTVGRCAVVPERAPKFTLQRSVAVLHPREDICSSRFLMYALQGKRSYIEGRAKGVAQKGIYLGEVANIEVPIPDKSTQTTIILRLDKIASIIQNRQQQLSALDDLIKARFVEMFGDCRDTTSAGDLMYTLRNGVSPSTSGRHHEKVLTLSAITQGQFDPDMWKDGMFDSIPTADKRICSTDFYMCRGNGNKSLVGAGVYSAEDRDDLVFPDTVIAASVDTTRVCLPYLFVAWMQPRIREQIENGARTTNGTYKINQQIISKIKVPLPPICEQLEFAAFVTQIDKSKFAIQKSLNETPLFHLTA